MADVARHPLVKGKYPVIAESLALAATRRRPTWRRSAATCFSAPAAPIPRHLMGRLNKRNPGSGCAAIGGFNRAHAVLGVGPSCVATYPGDFAQALIALGATVETWRGGERRTFPFAELHRPPGDRPDLETTLAADELILAFRAPAGDWTRRSRFLKIRDRKLTSSRSPRRPLRSTWTWRSCAAGADRARRRRDRALEGARGRSDARRPAGHPETAERAAEAAFKGAAPQKDNAFKIALGRKTLARALIETAAMEISAPSP